MLMPMQDVEVTDYLGAHRGANIIPGPFANAEICLRDYGTSSKRSKQIIYSAFL